MSQALFPDASKESNSSIESIAPLESGRTPALSKEAIAGIAVASALGVSLIIAGQFWWRRRQKTPKEDAASEYSEARKEVDGDHEHGAEVDAQYAQLHELGQES